MPLADLPLRQLLGARLRAPVFIDNDATVAALAEGHDEQLRAVAHNLVILTIGTGELLLAPAMRVARAYALPGVGTRTTIRLARHGVRAGVRGPALLAMHEPEES